MTRDGLSRWRRRVRRVLARTWIDEILLTAVGLVALLWGLRALAYVLAVVGVAS